MADEILPVKELRSPIGLEIGAVAAAIGVELVLVGIENIGVGVPVDRIGHDRQRMRCQYIVMVEERDELATRERDRRVARRADIAVDLAEDELDARLGRGLSLEDL